MQISQTNFTGGEVSPDTYGRIDIDKYYSGLKSAVNVVLHPQGGISNAPGTYFVGDVPLQDSQTRLIPFVFSVEQTYVLVFSRNKLQFIFDGGFIIDETDEIYEITTPFSDDILYDLDFNQSADVIIITHKNNLIKPQILKRIGSTNWTISDITYEPTLSAPTGVSVSVISGGTGKTWTYKITALTDDSDESRPSSQASVDGPKDSAPDKLVRVTWNAVSGAKRYFIYKKVGGSFGYVGYTDSTTFDDEWITPITSKSPPEATDPFSDGYYPKTSFFYQQRLGYANTASKPQDILFSKTSNYFNFDRSTPLQATDAIIGLTIAANGIDEILHVIPLGDIVVLTAASEWRLNVEGGLSPINIPNAVPQSYRGSSDAKPLVIGNNIIHVERNGRVVREMVYSLESGGYQSTSLNIIANHLFENEQVKEMVFAAEPYSIIYVLTESGKLFGFTYLKEQNVWGWHRHETKGTYESICSLPAKGNTDVYFVVKRKINGRAVRYIERLMPRIKNNDIRESFFVHSGLTYRSYAGDYTGTAVYDGVGFIIIFTVDQEGIITGSIEIDGESSTLAAELAATLGGGSWVLTGAVDENGTYEFETTEAITPEIDLLYFTGTVNKTFLASGVMGSGTKYANDEAGTWQAQNNTPEDATVTTISGLEHLEGEEVSILSDGSVEPNQIVENGQITLKRESALVTIGLGYETLIETLNINFGDQQQNIQGVRINVPRVVAYFKDSVSAFIGTSENEFYEMRFREAIFGEDPIPLFTGKKEITCGSGYSRQGRVLVKQTFPLPMTLLTIIPEIGVGS